MGYIAVNVRYDEERRGFEPITVAMMQFVLQVITEMIQYAIDTNLHCRDYKVQQQHFADACFASGMKMLSFGAILLALIHLAAGNILVVEEATCLPLCFSLILTRCACTERINVEKEALRVPIHID